MILTLEELALNAWPALQTQFYDGWILRYADGYTRRSNSVNPIYPSKRNLAQKIQDCESFYRSRNLPVTFKMTPDVYPENLDQQLEARGYILDAMTSVQTVELADLEFPTSPRYALFDHPNSSWFQAFCTMGKLSEKQRSILHGILGNITNKSCYVLIEKQGQAIATGLGVMERGYVGLFDIFTAEEYRKQGYGKAVVNAILNWAKQNGAHTSYLQVMCNNPPALHLYEKIGYKEQYTYWYRVKS
jgi:GNAT superfamily N-acetyltransferase